MSAHVFKCSRKTVQEKNVHPTSPLRACNLGLHSCSCENSVQQLQQLVKCIMQHFICVQEVSASGALSLPDYSTVLCSWLIGPISCWSSISHITWKCSLVVLTLGVCLYLSHEEVKTLLLILAKYMGLYMFSTCGHICAYVLLCMTPNIISYHITIMGR